MFDGIYGTLTHSEAAPVRLHGALDGDTVRTLRDMIVALGDFADHDVVLDLSGVSRLDGSGIGMIATLHRRLRQRGLSLTLVGVCGQPADLLRGLGLHRLIRAARRPAWSFQGQRAPAPCLAMS